MDRQREVAAEVNTLLERAAASRVLAKETGEALEAVPAALLRKAFDGVR